MSFPRWTFRIAGIYGLLVLPPQYLLFDRIGRDNPPAITHPEYFYGFVGLAIVWQIAFLLIANDPVRYRPLMLVGVAEKLSFGIPAIALFAQQGVSLGVAVFGCIDLVLGALFLLAWRATPSHQRAERQAPRS